MTDSQALPYQNKHRLFSFLKEHQSKLGKDLSTTTLGIYAIDIEQYLSFINRSHFPIPATAGFYIKELAKKYSYASIQRKVTSLRFYFEIQEIENLFLSDKVKVHLLAIKRKKRIKQKQAKAFDRGDLIKALDQNRGNNPKRIRDRALLLTSYLGALRMSELLALNVDDVEFYDKGILLHIRKSKTNQYGEPDVRSIPASQDPKYCGVKALQNLLDIVPNTPNLPLFYKMKSKHFRTNERLKARGFNYIIKKLLGNEYSSHSMRVSFVTNGRKLGASDSELMQQTKHKTPAMIRRYTQIHDVREHNAVNRLIL